MIKKSDTFSEKKQAFFLEYAKANQLDSLQLQILHMICEAGGKVTWFSLMEEIPFGRSQIQQCVTQLEWQDLLWHNFDIVSLTDYAPFVVDDVMADFNKKLADYLEQFEDNQPETRFLA